jgi:hypothetical protein
MKSLGSILITLISLTAVVTKGQESGSGISDTLMFRGQLSAWAHGNPSNELPVYTGGRYIPQINYEINFPQNRMIDFEFSANTYGNIGTDFADSLNTSGKIKPYRAWIRYSTRQLEIRAGLQKINFGSAAIIRPLMWFDQVDPRDPLQLTDGVWGLLIRYYFLNNANIWLWSLYSHGDIKGWELVPSNKYTPEFGGRIQVPVPRGELGMSYHHRIADTRDLDSLVPVYAHLPENRFGLDIRFDYVIGCWLEASYNRKSEDLGFFTNQEIINLGIDYTFGIGNGLYGIFEQLIYSSDQDAFTFKNTTTFSLLSLSYPVGLFDKLSAIIYYNWTDNSLYNFINWQRDFNRISLYVMGYWNPENYHIPLQGSGENLYAGKGIMLMIVFNH